MPLIASRNAKRQFQVLSVAGGGREIEHSYELRDNWPAKRESRKRPLANDRRWPNAEVYVRHMNGC